MNKKFFSMMTPQERVVYFVILVPLLMFPVIVINSYYHKAKRQMPICLSSTMFIKTDGTLVTSLGPEKSMPYYVFVNESDRESELLLGDLGRWYPKTWDGWYLMGMVKIESLYRETVIEKPGDAEVRLTVATREKKQLYGTRLAGPDIGRWFKIVVPKDEFPPSRHGVSLTLSIIVPKKTRLVLMAESVELCGLLPEGTPLNEITPPTFFGLDAKTLLILALGVFFLFIIVTTWTGPVRIAQQRVVIPSGVGRIIWYVFFFAFGIMLFLFICPLYRFGIVSLAKHILFIIMIQWMFLLVAVEYFSNRIQRREIERRKMEVQDIE